MTVGIISACIAAFIVQGALDGPSYAEFLARYSFIPAMMISGVGGGMLSNITSMFLHAGPAHLLGNMLALWVFGRRVEDACGPWRFLAFYLLAGTGANILYALVERGQALPSIGASGAIFGVMGDYLLLYPAGRIMCPHEKYLSFLYITFSKEAV